MSPPKVKPTSRSKLLGIHAGQRLRCIIDGELVDIVSVKDGATALTSTLTLVEFVMVTGPHKGSHFTMNLDTVSFPSYFEKLRGKPYVAGVDEPRAMGARKPRKKKEAGPVWPAVTPFVTPIHEELADMSVNTEEAKNIATAIATAISASIPTKETVADEVRVQVQEHTAKMLDGVVSPALNDLHAIVKSGIEVVDERNQKLTAAIHAAIASGGTPVKTAIRRAIAKLDSTDKDKKKATGGNVIVDVLSQFYEPGVEAPANVLLASPPSFGKSHSIRKLGEEYDVFLEHGCSDDMDEISTLLGSPLPDGKGGFIMVDGVLTEAVRAASIGKTVLFLLDEVLRLTPRAQEWLLTFLTGVKRNDGTRFYRLRTRRALPDGNLEVIECPSTNLHIVSATNLSILNPIEAFWSRWETVRIEFTLDQATATASSILNSYGIADRQSKLAKMWASIVKESRERYSKGELRFPVDFRILERSAAMVDTGLASDVASFAAGRIKDNVANWHPDTGDMSADGEATVVAWSAKLETLANEERAFAEKKAAENKAAGKAAATVNS